MTIQSFTVETDLADFRFVKTPEQIRHLKDLPNWSVSVRSLDVKKTVKLYLVIHQKSEVGMAADMIRVINDEVCAVLYTWFSWRPFIAEFGNLDWLSQTDQLHHPMSKDRSAAVEIQNFFNRRGRNTQSRIEALKKKCSPITLGMESDLVFSTSCDIPARRRGITGSVIVAQQHHYFSLEHPLFDMSRIMTGGDARKFVTQHLRKAFPFITLPLAKDWAFDNQVQGK